jgi:hypothetical protein
MAASNQNSIYILDNQASIVIHNHHFDARQFKQQQPQQPPKTSQAAELSRATMAVGQQLMQKNASASNYSQVRFDDSCNNNKQQQQKQQSTIDWDDEVNEYGLDEDEANIYSHYIPPQQQQQQQQTQINNMNNNNNSMMSSYRSNFKSNTITSVTKNYHISSSGGGNRSSSSIDSGFYPCNSPYLGKSTRIITPQSSLNNKKYNNKKKALERARPII